MNEHPRFAAAGARQHQRRPGRRSDRLALRVIQTSEQVRYVHQGADCTVAPWGDKRS